MKTVIRPKPDAKSKTTKTSSKKSTKAKARPKRNVSSSPVAEGDRRRSGRARQVSHYTERPDQDDEEEMLEGVADWKYEDDDDEDDDAVDSEVSDEEDGDDSEVEKSPAEEEEEEQQEEAQDEPSPPRNGRKASAAKPIAKPSPIKSSVLAQLQKGTRSTRARGGRSTRGASDMDVDDDDE